MNSLKLTVTKSWDSLSHFLTMNSSEVGSSKIVEEFKSNLKGIESQKLELEYSLLNGADKVMEHCIQLRIDVDLATETAHRDINLQRDTFLDQINAYQAETIGLIKIETKAREEFKKVINELHDFRNTWRTKLEKRNVDENKVARTSEMVVSLRKKADRKQIELNSLIFNEKMLVFKNKTFGVSIGHLRFTPVRAYDLSQFKQIDIAELFQHEEERIDDFGYIRIFPVEDTFDILYGLIEVQALELKKIDKEKNEILRAYGYGCNYYSRHKDTILTSQLYFENNIWTYGLELYDINLDEFFEGIYDVMTGLDRSCHLVTYATDTNVYCYVNEGRLDIYNRELDLIESAGQEDGLAGAFYTPKLQGDRLQQFEFRNGKFFWLSDSHLEISEDHGELIKSIEIQAQNFVFDSTGRIVLFDKISQELNYFAEDGTLVERVLVDNCEDLVVSNCEEVSLSLTQDDEPVLFDQKSLTIYFI